MRFDFLVSKTSVHCTANQFSSIKPTTRTRKVRLVLDVGLCYIRSQYEPCDIGVQYEMRYWTLEIRKELVIYVMTWPDPSVGCHHMLYPCFLCSKHELQLFVRYCLPIVSAFFRSRVVVFNITIRFEITIFRCAHSTTTNVLYTLLRTQKKSF